MSNVTPLRRPINWKKLRSDEAERIVRQRAHPNSTGYVIFTNHAWDRVSERDIPREDAFKILRTGHCVDPPIRNEHGHWQVIIVKRIGNIREAGIVTVILEDEEKLIVRTIEWMDLK